ncbi:hypothetical protein CW751_08935 [Brumimicrobium salinarum]|uniref:PPM-type phosphatase domain-containing protein n=1 Tax=Brumimicrobium salinarum TaxID=2058658 RepID=A0A2I0R1M5_9FLAO|nr:SpoIIE family protein phosphatase [Brumimicrobium salinarum]PKR80491.1 hypothetical protein CW751_08935 [Brumimicrobium salinarum]
MKRLLKHLLLYVSIFPWLWANAQNEFPPITNFNADDYGHQFSPENIGICQDNRGVMYFGNTGNILTFDGNRWDSISVVPTRACYALHHSKKGNIYVGTLGDFGQLKPNKYGKYVYHSLIDSAFRKDYSFHEIWDIHETPDGIFFQSEEQIFLLKENKITALEMPSTAHTTFNVNQQLVARMRGIGLMTWKNKQWIKVENSEAIKDYGVFGIVPTQEKHIKIVITQELGLFKLNTKSNTLYPHPTAHDKQILSYILYGAKAIGDQKISLQTRGKGLIIINHEGKELYRIDNRMGLVSNDIERQFIDVDGNLWITTANGISLINQTSRLSYFSAKQGVHGGVEAILHDVYKDRELLYIGTNEGLFRLTQSHKKSIRIFEKIEGINYSVWDLSRHKNHLFISTSEGFFVADIEDAQLKITKINRENTNKSYLDQANNILVNAGMNGVSVYDLTTLTLLYRYKNELTTISGIEKQITEDGTNYWIGAIGQGVIKLKKTDHFDVELFMGTELGFPQDHILVPQILNKKVVLGSTQGVLSVDETEMDGETYTFFMPTTLGDSLLEGPIFDLHDEADRTWYSIDNQVGVFDKKKNTFTNRPFWGIKKGRINTLYRSSDAPYLWIGSSDGLIRYQIEGEIPFKNDFKAIISAVKNKANQTIFGGIHHEEFIPINMEYKKNYLNIEFSAPYFEDRQALEYTYWLKNYEKDWSAWSNKTKIELTNLPDGKYTFKVKARNVYHQESEIAEISFTILTPWYKTSYAILGYFIILLLLIYGIVKISLYRLKQQNKRLEVAVTERTHEIALKNTRLEEQKAEIIHQKTEIEDSINYAQRIQSAILPIKEEMLQKLGDAFVLFWPKDVVSGDFYWYYRQNDISVVVCADCTGHGVPGAFMSMIGVDKLNVCVQEKGITNPSEILSFLNQGIKTSLRQDETKNATRDGMDAAILTINHSTQRIQYAGANRPLWMMSNNEFSEIKATKVAVGGFTPADQVFELHEFNLINTTRFYMSSDGYADQFGGPKGKKFKIKKMKNLIIENHKRPMQEQQELLENTMKKWAEGHEQIDDICVIGLTIEKQNT